MTASTPAERLRASLEAAKQRAELEQGRPLAWDEHEAELIDRLADAADRRALLQRLFTAEAKGQQRARELAALSSEIRQLDRLTSTFLGRVLAGLKPETAPTFTQKRAATAANARWRAEFRKRAEERSV